MVRHWLNSSANLSSKLTRISTRTNPPDEILSHSSAERFVITAGPRLHNLLHKSFVVYSAHESLSVQKNVSLHSPKEICALSLDSSCHTGYCRETMLVNSDRTLRVPANKTHTNIPRLKVLSGLEKTPRGRLLPCIAGLRQAL